MYVYFVEIRVCSITVSELGDCSYWFTHIVWGCDLTVIEENMPPLYILSDGVLWECRSEMFR